MQSRVFPSVHPPRIGAQPRVAMCNLARLLLGVCAAILVASPSHALDFSSSDLVYEETYAGESTFPTSPETDTLALGGLGGDSTNPSSFFPILNGTVVVAAHETAPESQYVFLDASASPVEALGFRARAHFDDLVPGIQPTFSSVSLSFDGAPGVAAGLTAALEFNAGSSELEITEAFAGSPVATLTVPLFPCSRSIS